MRLATLVAVDHLENTKGFNLRQLKYLVMDEADRMLSMDFEEELNKILAEVRNCEERSDELVINCLAVIHQLHK